MFQIDPTSRVPIYEQIYNSVIKFASLGIIKPGDKLPPVRSLASQLAVNPNTVAKAYRDLEQKGYIYSAVGRGSFVSDKLDDGAARKHMALSEFKDAGLKAASYGATHSELAAVTEEIFKGGKVNND